MRLETCKKVPGKITDKYMKNIKQASEELKHRYAPQIFKYNPLLCSFSLQFIYFFQNSRFTEIIGHSQAT